MVGVYEDCDAGNLRKLHESLKYCVMSESVISNSHTTSLGIHMKVVDKKVSLICKIDFSESTTG